MERDDDAHNVDCGGATFECNGLVAIGSLGDINGYGGEQRGKIQGLKGEGVGGVGQNIEVQERASVDVMVTILRSDFVSSAISSTILMRLTPLKAEDSQR